MFKKSQKGQLLILLIIGLLVIASIMIVGGFSLPEKQEVGTPFAAIVIPNNSPDTSKNLQLKKIEFQVFCGADDGQCHPPNSCNCNDFRLTCDHGKCTSLDGQAGFCNSSVDTYCSTACGNNPGSTCYGKPVIMLYPTSDTFVDVEVVTSGKIIVSDPTYPTGGWKNVLAKPNGSLTYQGKHYSELFYESEVKNTPPQDGIVIASSSLGPKLKSIIYKLGLNEAESTEFLNYWLPKLKDLNSPYILFSLIDSTTKELNDRVIINPQPTTRIEFIAYFKPLAYPIAVQTLNPQQRPKRIGFTEVEWGGTIDSTEDKTLMQ